MSGEIGARHSTTVSGLSEDEILRGLFRKCDASYNTGQVRAQDLLSALKDLLDTDGVLDQSSLDALTRLIDPRNDNSYLEMGDFVKLGLMWITSIRLKSNEHSDLTSFENNLQEFITPRQLPAVFQSKRLKALRQTAGHNESLGILPEEYTANSSFEQSFNSALDDLALAKKIEELRSENEELLKRVARLQKEKNDRDQDFMYAEDTIEDLKQEMKRLERVIKEKEACQTNGVSDTDESIPQPQKNTLDYSPVWEYSEERTKSLSLSFENSRLKGELKDCQSLLMDMDALKLHVKKLENQLANKELELSEVCNAKEMLSFRLNEMKLQSPKVCETSGLEDPQRFDFFSNLHEELSEVDIDHVFDTSVDKPELLNEVFGKSFTVTKAHAKFAFSTPGVRGSIGEEIKSLGMKGPPLFEISGVTKDCIDEAIQTDEPLESQDPDFKAVQSTFDNCIDEKKINEINRATTFVQLVTGLAFLMGIFLTLLRGASKPYPIPCHDLIPATICSFDYSLQAW